MNFLSPRDLRYFLRDILRKLQRPGSNPEKCGRTPISSVVEGHLKNGRAGWRGLVNCGQAPACPVCAYRIAVKQGKKIKLVIDQVESEGGAVGLGTATFPHYLDDALQPLKKVMLKSFTRMMTGPAFLRATEKYGILGWCRSPDYTRGQNGHHPHIHFIYFTRQPLTDAQRVAWEDFLYRRWDRIIYKAIGRHPSVEHGLRLSQGENAGDYINQVTKKGFADELTRSDSKSGRSGNRSIFQIIYDYAESGRAFDKALILEYMAAFRGCRQLTWSKSMKRYRSPEQSDFELVQDEADPPDEIFIRIPARTWIEITRRDPSLPSRMLEVAESLGGAAVTDFLNAYFDGHPP